MTKGVKKEIYTLPADFLLNINIHALNIVTDNMIIIVAAINNFFMIL